MDEQNPILRRALQDLDGLIGLEEIKGEIRSLINLLKFNALRIEHRLPPQSGTMHMVFCGNPGTAKTSVARIVGRLLGALGILKRGHLVEADRSRLVAAYLGQTAIKTNEIIDEALDGVLFIDEAYSLVNEVLGDDYGDEAIQVLLKRMEDDRKRLVVILAGYPEPMARLVASNPGLPSRINRTIRFPDYSSCELLKIFLAMCQKNKYDCELDAKVKLFHAFEHLVSSRDATFGNARTARNLFDGSVRRLADRIALMSEIDDVSLRTIMPSDIDLSIVDLPELPWRDVIHRQKFLLCCAETLSPDDAARIHQALEVHPTETIVAQPLGVPESDGHTAATPTSKVVIVGSIAGATARTISSALEMADDGDAIVVLPGVYDERLNIEKSIELIGAGPRGSIVIRQRDQDTCVTLRARNVVLRNCLIHTGDRLPLKPPRIAQRGAIDICAGNAALCDCDVVGARSAGITIRKSAAEILLSSCVVGAAGDGVYCEAGYVKITTCTIRSGFRTGVNLTGRAICSLESSVVMNCLSHGLEVSRTANVTARDSRFASNAGSGIHLHVMKEESEDAVFRMLGTEVPSVIGSAAIYSCEISGNSQNGLYAGLRSRPYLKSCVLEHNGGSGIVSDKSSLTVIDSTVRKNAACGVEVEHAVGEDDHENVTDTFRDVLVLENDIGIRVEWASALFADCTIRGNKANDVLVDNSLTTFADCTIQSEDLGPRTDAIVIRGEHSDHVKFKRCRVRGASTGFVVESGAEVDLEECRVHECSTAIHSTNGQISLSRSVIDHAHCGIHLQLSHMNVVDCNVRNVGTGLRIDRSDIEAHGLNVENCAWGIDFENGTAELRQSRIAETDVGVRVCFSWIDVRQVKERSRIDMRDCTLESNGAAVEIPSPNFQPGEGNEISISGSVVKGNECVVSIDLDGDEHDEVDVRKRDSTELARKSTFERPFVSFHNCDLQDAVDGESAYELGAVAVEAT